MGGDGARIRAVVGQGLAGPMFRGTRGIVLGMPAWGPLALLRDLELRLGLPPADEDTASRLPRWTARMKSLDHQDAFYMRSFLADELGTAAALLDWRDALVESGWNGDIIARGGPRLDALAALERHAAPKMQLGQGDRLARVERELASLSPASSARIYARLALCEPPSLWPGRWRRLFSLLAERGTSLAPLSLDLPGAPPATDLGLLQARLRGEKTEGKLRGDGTLLVLRGNTPTDLADLTASILAGGRAVRAVDVVVRCRDPEPLETALHRHGLPLQGCTSRSVWRPAMQVLPLAVELAFEPRDPYRLLELLTLPVGPFRGVVGARLARAVARQPGIGGKEWRLQQEEARTRLRERHLRLERQRGLSDAEAERLAREVVAQRFAELEAWLEAPASSDGRIAKSSLIAVVSRVRSWLQSRVRKGDRETYAYAYAHAYALESAVGSDSREHFSLEEARQLVDRYARSEQPHDTTVEAAGRVAHLDHPTGILGSYDRVLLWSFVAGVERRAPRPPWNNEERAALAEAGIDLADPFDLLTAEADAWRRSVLAARQRAILVIPRTIKATAAADHPLWDEIRARLALDDDGVARITHDVSRIVDGSTRSALAPVTALAPVRLPEGRREWHVRRELIGETSSSSTTSVSALEALATCPLAWVFEHRAVLRSGAVSKVAEGALLNGILGHRLVEELHADGAFELPEMAFVERVAALFDRLLRTEAATLLLAGASIERLQLQRQIHHAMRELHRYLAKTGRRIASVEEVVTTDSAAGALHGRLDLRLEDRHGRTDRPAILDLKWGSSRYRDALVKGRAVQLAVYSRAVARASASPPPPAAYFSLANGQLIATDERMAPARQLEGPSLETTWTRVEATARAVLARVGSGVLHVIGTKDAVPLLDALEIPEARREHYFEAPREDACSHCEYAALCGRKWEALT
ncbi:MAG TPA: PD-(D/E)XK nuclease family protein [Labilithrix sp.]|nr:PD-(D/E)XK nuclease family protein [Labilithrix sp.]